MKEKIKIFLKTFYGKRSIFPFEILPTEKISDLVIKLVIEEEKQFASDKEYAKWKIGSQYRLVSTNGRIRELNPMKNYIEENIANDETLLLLPANSISFSDSMKAYGIYLESKNKVASKGDTDEPKFALSDIGFSFGRHYIEFSLETEPLERSVVIGVSLKRTDYSLSSSDITGFYGYILSDCKKVSNKNGKNDQEEFGDVTKIGDKVGLLLEFSPTGCDVTYYINKINMGTAFKNLPLDIYYPCVVLGLVGTKIRITNKVEFPDM